MLGLIWRGEFREQHWPATAVSLIELHGTGATPVAADGMRTIT